VNLSEIYSYRLIGKLTSFLLEFCQRNQIVDSSTTVVRLFLLYSDLVGNILTKVSVLRINLNIDGAPIT
jgi:hypothetical protein